MQPFKVTQSLLSRTISHLRRLVVAARSGRAFGNLCHLGNASTLDLVLLWRGMQRGGYTCPFLARPALGPYHYRYKPGRGRGLGRVLGVGVTLGAGVGVEVGVAVGVGVGVGLAVSGTIA